MMELPFADFTLALTCISEREPMAVTRWKGVLFFHSMKMERSINGEADLLRRFSKIIQTSKKNINKLYPQKYA